MRLEKANQQETVSTTTNYIRCHYMQKLKNENELRAIRRASIERMTKALHGGQPSWALHSSKPSANLNARDLKSV